MTSRDFCFWLQGFLELRDSKDSKDGMVTEEQISIIKRHLAPVFKHEIDPSMGSESHQEKLNEIHTNLDQVTKTAEEVKKQAGSGHMGPIVMRC